MCGSLDADACLYGSVRAYMCTCRYTHVHVTNNIDT